MVNTEVNQRGNMCSLDQDSNLGPLAYRANALPIELPRPPDTRTTTHLPLLLFGAWHQPFRQTYNGV